VRLVCPIDVVLNSKQVAYAERMGYLRYQNALTHNCGQDDGGSMDDALQRDIDGCYGELTFSVATGRAWVDNFMLPDFGHNIQVRCAPCKAARSPEWFGRMILRPKILVWTGTKFVDKGDDPKDNFVLVTGNPPYFRIEGWEVGYKIMRQEFKRIEANRPWAWFVPKSHLRLDLWQILD
jgi:hypothetical protein